MEGVNRGWPNRILGALRRAIIIVLSLLRQWQSQTASREFSKRLDDVRALRDDELDNVQQRVGTY